MARFYECSECGKEFLGSDDVPEDDNILTLCYACYEHYEICIVCNYAFRANCTGDILGDMCNHCWENPPEGDQTRRRQTRIGRRRTCGCGDAFFPANRDTSEKSCATCAMLDKIQIDENLKEMGKFTAKKSQDFTNADSKAVVELRQGVIDLIRQNYDVEIKPFQIITQDFVDKLFTKEEL